jgi:C1A family cysteine protease
LEFEARNNKTTALYSEQSLVDCDKLDKGCEGGSPLTALVWSRFSGVATEGSYKYAQKQGACKTVDKSQNYSSPYNFCFLNYNSETNMVNAMNKFKKPFAAAIHTNGTDFALYKSGVFLDSKCKSNVTFSDHVVVIVGYGRDAASKLDFWLVRNSWGRVSILKSF